MPHSLELSPRKLSLGPWKPQNNSVNLEWPYFPGLTEASAAVLNKQGNGDGN